MRRVIILLLLTLTLTATANASSYWAFTFNSGNGTVGYGNLTATSSGLSDDSLLVQSGNLILTSSADGNFSLGDYSLIPIGPNPTISQSGMFEVDDLIYPSNDAASGVNPGFSTGISYLTYWGLLFGQPGTGSQNEINIWGNGNANYAYGSEKGGGFTNITYNGGTFTLVDPPPPGNTSVPEPGSLALSSVGLGFLLMFEAGRRQNLLQRSTAWIRERTH